MIVFRKSVHNYAKQGSHNLRKFRQIYAVSMGVVAISHNEDALFSEVCCLILNYPTPI